MATQKETAAGQPKGGLLLGLSDDLAQAVARAGMSVVRVNARRRGSATGIVWSEDGVVVTADHVVEVEEGITLGLPDGREVPATLAGRDPGTDLAVLRAEAKGLAVAETVEGNEVKVGNLVLAVGRPREGGPMATLGIVSAWTGPWRTWRGGLLDSLLQTDVTLYPGFSGGPLVDVAGRVAGLNTSILARGVSVAIPAEIVRRVAEALLTQGKVRRGFLGVSTQPVSLPAALRKQLSPSQETGLLVIGVEPGGPADQGGMILGDVLIGLAGQPTRDAADLQAVLGPDRVGVATAVKVIRGGEPRDLTVTIGERK